MISVIIVYQWLSVGYRWLSVVIIGYQWLLLVIIGYQWLSLVNSLNAVNLYVALPTSRDGCY